MNVLPAGITIVPPLPHVDRALLMAGTSSIEMSPADAGVQMSRFDREKAWPNTVLNTSKANQMNFFISINIFLWRMKLQPAFTIYCALSAKLTRGDRERKRHASTIR